MSENEASSAPIKRLVITAPPRSGTAYMYRLLEAIGIKAGHELPTYPGGAGWGDCVVNVSWQEAFTVVPSEHCAVAVQVRNPLKVVSSMAIYYARTAKQGEGWEKYELSHQYMPRLYGLKDFREKAASAYGLIMKSLGDMRPAAFFYRVEELDRGLCKMLIDRFLGVRGIRDKDIKRALEETPKDVNKSPPGFEEHGNLETLSPFWKEQLESVACTLGYGLDL